MVYTTKEVKWLVEHYQDKGSCKPADVIRYADLEVSYPALSQLSRDILFMVGVCGMDKTTVGFLRDLHRNTVARQYLEGIKSLTEAMNGLPTEEGDYERES